jgi:hypothetical protein
MNDSFFERLETGKCGKQEKQAAKLGVRTIGSFN